MLSLMLVLVFGFAMFMAGRAFGHTTNPVKSIDTILATYEKLEAKANDRIHSLMTEAYEEYKKTRTVTPEVKRLLKRWAAGATGSYGGSYPSLDADYMVFLLTVVPDSLDFMKEEEGSAASTSPTVGNQGATWN